MVFKQLFNNNAVSLLARGIGAEDTTLTVLAGHGAMFPSPGENEFFTVTLEDQAAQDQEIVHVFARNGDTFTIARGREGTTARAWTASQGRDTLVDHRVTAATLSRLANDYDNPDFESLTSYKEALDYLLAQKPGEMPDLTAVNAAIADLQANLGPVFDRVQTLEAMMEPFEVALDELQQQVILNNGYSNTNFPVLTNLTEAVDYLLQGNPTANEQEVDPPVTTSIVGEETIITLPTAYKPGTTAVYVGGVRQKRGVDFKESGATELRLQFILTDEQIADGQNVVVDYVVA